MYLSPTLRPDTTGLSVEQRLLILEEQVYENPVTNEGATTVVQELADRVMEMVKDFELQLAAISPDAEDKGGFSIFSVQLCCVVSL